MIKSIVFFAIAISFVIASDKMNKMYEPFLKGKELVSESVFVSMY